MHSWTQFHLFAQRIKLVAKRKEKNLFILWFQKERTTHMRESCDLCNHFLLQIVAQSTCNLLVLFINKIVLLNKDSQGRNLGKPTGCFSQCHTSCLPSTSASFCSSCVSLWISFGCSICCSTCNSTLPTSVNS